MQEILQPLSGHAIFLLLLQLATLLILARVLAAVMERLGQPAVIGELLAGVLLGPSILGFLAPDLFFALFPSEVEQFHLLEVVSWIGMVLLLLLTGLETDIRAMRNLGRAAVMASVFGMVIPFASGLALGWWLPDRFLVETADRPIFAAFLATAMAISAMPVIAKILIDLGLVRRNVGMVILAAAVVDDTTGWLILSIIAGVAAGGTFSPAELGVTLLWLAAFLAALRWIVYPLFSRAVRYLNERGELAGADLTLIVGFTFVAAAITEAMGVHAVFGAFAAGVVVRQVPRLRARTVEILEVFVLSALAPIFFAFVGLRVDLWTLSGWQFPLLVIGVAVGGKLVGCYVGGRLGRLSHWESLAIGFGMNARGAMELIVALIGLSLGLLTQEVYATIVMVAVVTSFMAPVLLRIAVPHIPMRSDERRRLEHDGRQSFVPTGSRRILVPTAGGSNALSALQLAASLVHGGRGEVTAFYVDTREEGRRGHGLLRRRDRDLAGTNLVDHLERAAGFVGGENGRFTERRVRGDDVAKAVLDEVARDYDLVMLGAAPERPLDDPLVLRIARASRIPVVIVRHQSWFDPRDVGEDSGERPFARLLVPFDGSLASRYAAEVAFACSGAIGSTVTILHVTSGGWSGRSGMAHHPDAEPLTIESEIEKELRSAAAAHGASTSIRILDNESPTDVMIAESRSGRYDLLILGAENKLLGAPLFYGQGTAEIVERAGCTTAVVLPGGDPG